MGLAEESTVLSSWKDIARYLGKGVRTVQRWEQHLGLPVRRPVGASQKSAVLLHREDVDAWLVTRFAAREIKLPARASVRETTARVRTELRENLLKARDLHTASVTLSQQIAEAVRKLSERCDCLSNTTVQGPWRSSAVAAEVIRANRPTAPEIAS